MDSLAVLGVAIDDEVLLNEALTHRSVAHDRSHHPHNERLEFLGDAVLELSVTDYLYRHYPKSREGQLTSYRSALVCKESLGMVAVSLELGQYIRMSRGEKKTGGAEKEYILANVVEALIGALYIHGGYDLADSFVQQHIIPLLPQIIEQGAYIDSKSSLQEIAQAEVGITPNYQLRHESGEDHNKVFEYAVLLNAKVIGSGKGSSKKKAQMDAASNALTNRTQWSKMTA